jgi:acetyltransferase-like isoleucine patch superfamily enzyme
MRLPASVAIQIALFLLPWRLRRLGLLFLGYRIHRSARVGFSIIHSKKVDLGPASCIGHLNWIADLDELTIGESGSIGQMNWITGPGKLAPIFAHVKGRVSALRIGRHASILNRHHVDCTHTVEIGDWTIVSGWYTQIVTHGANPVNYRISCSPIRIGSNSVLGTGCIILKGTEIADCSCISAGSCLSGKYRESYTLIAGSPARVIRDLPRNGVLFTKDRPAAYHPELLAAE